MSGEDALVTFETLPRALQLDILRWLSVPDLLSFAQVSKSCASLASDNLLWARLACVAFGREALALRDESRHLLRSAVKNPVATHLSSCHKVREVLASTSFRATVRCQGTRESPICDVISRRPLNTYSGLEVACFGDEDFQQAASAQLAEQPVLDVRQLNPPWQPTKRPGPYKSPPHDKVLSCQKVYTLEQSVWLSFRLPESVRDHAACFDITVEAETRHAGRGTLRHLISQPRYCILQTDMQRMEHSHSSGLYIWQAEDEDVANVADRFQEGVQMMVYLHYEQFLDYLGVQDGLSAVLTRSAPSRTARCAPAPSIVAATQAASDHAPPPLDALANQVELIGLGASAPQADLHRANTGASSSSCLPYIMVGDTKAATINQTVPGLTAAGAQQLPLVQLYVFLDFHLVNDGSQVGSLWTPLVLRTARTRTTQAASHTCPQTVHELRFSSAFHTPQSTSVSCQAPSLASIFRSDARPATELAGSESGFTTDRRQELREWCAAARDAAMLADFSIVSAGGQVLLGRSGVEIWTHEGEEQVWRLHFLLDALHEDGRFDDRTARLTVDICGDDAVTLECLESALMSMFAHAVARTKNAQARCEE